MRGHCFDAWHAPPIVPHCVRVLGHSASPTHSSIHTHIHRRIHILTDTRTRSSLNHTQPSKTRARTHARAAPEQCASVRSTLAYCTLHYTRNTAMNDNDNHTCRRTERSGLPEPHNDRHTPPESEEQLRCFNELQAVWHGALLPSNAARCERSAMTTTQYNLVTRSSWRLAACKVSH